VDSAADIPPNWLERRKHVGITAGASTPEVLVEQVVDQLKNLGFTRLQEVEWIAEDVRFALPPELRLGQTY
jgi:4-hydroxy-3-methylbut-2-enyl diphosphate reductase